MWTSQRRREPPVREAPAELGAVTLGGDPAGVSLGGERRQVAVYAPGGYCWRPGPGERVLVLKAGVEGEVPCILGRAQDSTDLKQGEVRLSGGVGKILLSERGVELEGQVYVNGETLEQLIAAIVSELLG